MIEIFTDEIIQSSKDNSAGTLLNRNAINEVVRLLINNRCLDKDYIDNLIIKNGTESGYMVKTSDFIYILNSFITSDDLQYNDLLEKPEKDYEMIEILYGDYHAECGDRD